MKLIDCKFLLILLLICSCGAKKTSYVFHDNIAPLEQYSELHSLDQLQVEAKVDILVAVDNSGSMGNVIENVQQNASRFFEAFIDRDDIDWNLGVIAITQGQNGVVGRPFLGFEEPFGLRANFFLNKSSVIRIFNDSFSRLIFTRDAGAEYVFASVEKVLTDENLQYQNFRRKDAHLIVIMITDEIEWSNSYSNDDEIDHYSADIFLDRLVTQLDVDKSKVRFYGVLEAFFRPALRIESCYDRPPDPYMNAGAPGSSASGQYDYDLVPNDQINYSSSAYKRIIDETGGRVVSSCDENFGTQLATIGSDIASFVSLKSVPLERRPRPESIEIYHNDRYIPGGMLERGGFWFYEEISNSINFYNTDFIDDITTDQLFIRFDVDDGIDDRDQ